jgi:hypothetical protein
LFACASALPEIARTASSRAATNKVMDFERELLPVGRSVVGKFLTVSIFYSQVSAETETRDLHKRIMRSLFFRAGVDLPARNWWKGVEPGRNALSQSLNDVN